MSTFVKFLIIVVTSFAAAVCLFLVFDNNEAAVDWGDNVVRLGGPIAGFIGTAVILTLILQRLQTSQAEVDALVATARRKEIEDLLGGWVVQSSSVNSTRKAQSQTTFRDDNGRLDISGGTFFDINPDGSTGASIGDWSCDASIYDGSRLIYLYTLTDRLSEGGTRVWRGVADARRSVAGDGTEFTGRWEVFGTDHHEGTIRLTRS